MTRSQNVTGMQQDAQQPDQESSCEVALDIWIQWNKGGHKQREGLNKGNRLLTRKCPYRRREVQRMNICTAITKQQIQILK